MLRFDHQSCEWSTIDLAHIDWATSPDEPLEDEESSKDKQKKKKAKQ